MSIKIFDLGTCIGDSFNFTETCHMIAETEKDIPWGTVIKLDKYYYSICMAKEVEGGNGKFSDIAVRKLDKFSPKGEDTLEDNFLLCPVCGYKDYDTCEITAGEHYCSHCHSLLDVDVDYTATYFVQTKKASKLVKL